MKKWLALLCLLVLCTLGLTIQPSPTGPGSDGAADGSKDTVPQIRRRAVDAADLPALLEKMELVRWKRDDFEELVRKARAAQSKQSSPPPRLVEARYRAELVENGTEPGSPPAVKEPGLKGSALWKLHVEGSTPQVLPLVPFSLALRSARFPSAEALVGNFSGSDPGVLITENDQRTLNLEWSRRGAQAPDGLHFEWRVPPAPIALLELYLPVGRSVRVSPEDALVTGPHRSESPKLRRWEIHFSGKDRLHLVVSRESSLPNNVNGPRHVLRTLHSVHVLRSHRQTFSVDVGVELRGRGSTILRLPWDPRFQPERIQAPGLVEWRPRKTGANDALTELELKFHSPPRGLLAIQVRGRRVDLSPTWTSLQLRFPDTWATEMDGIEESLQLRLPKGVSFENLRSGSFQLQEAQTDGDGNYRLQFSTRRSFAAEQKQDASPLRGVRLTIRSEQPRYRVSVLGWWQLNGLGLHTPERFAAKIAIHVEHGELFEMPFLMSQHWEIDRVTTQPQGRVQLASSSINSSDEHPDLNRFWGSILPQGLRIARVQFAAPLRKPTGAAATPTYVHVTFRPRSLAAVERSAHGHAFPLCLPLGARETEVGIGVEWDADQFRVSFQKLTKPVLGVVSRRALRGATALDDHPAPIGTRAPWDQTAPRRYFRWTNQAPAAAILLQPRATALTVKSVLNLEPLQGRALGAEGPLPIQLRMSIRVERGRTDQFVLALSHSMGASPSNWQATISQDKSAGDRSVKLGAQRLPALPSPALSASFVGSNAFPFAGIAPLGSLFRQERWRLRLPERLRAGDTLTLAARCVLPAESRGSWIIPAVSVEGAASGHVEASAPRHVQVRDLLMPLELVPQPFKDSSTPASFAERYPREESSQVVSFQLRGGQEWLLARLRAPTSSTGKQQRADARARTGFGVIPRAELVTQLSLDAPGRLVHLLTFQIKGCAHAALPIRIPPMPGRETRILALRIDGRRAPAPSSASGDGLTLDVPVPQAEEGTSSRVVELLYETQGSHWSQWVGLTVSTPVLPVEPLVFRRRWRLPKQLVPTGDDVLRLLPQDARSLTWIQTGPELPRLAKLWSWEDSDEQQRTIIQQADGSLGRQAAGQEWPLARVVAHLAVRELATRGHALVIDAEAFDRAGLHPQQIVRLRAVERSSGGWTLQSVGSADLVALPARHAILLTTKKEVQDWNNPAEVSSSMVQAVREAVLHGRSSTGRAWLAQVWTRRGAGGASLTNERWAPLLPDDPALVDWEAIGPADATVWVMHRELPSLIGASLAGLFLFVLLLLRGSFRRQWAQALWRSRHGADEDDQSMRSLELRMRIALGSLLVWLGACGIAWLWLPATWQTAAAWPCLPAAVVALWWYVRPITSCVDPARSKHSASGRSAILAATSLLLCVMVGSAPFAASQKSIAAKDPSADAKLVTDVYVDGPFLDKSKQVVYAPPELLRRLELAARMNVKRARQPVIVAADYAGKAILADDKLAHFEAVFTVFCHDDRPCEVHLPVFSERANGLDLTKAVLVDGAHAWPKKPPKDSGRKGYLVPLKGAGRHKVHLSFAVRIEDENGRRSLHFRLPRVAKSRLVLDVPRDACRLHCTAKLGLQRVSRTADSARLEADLGAGSLRQSVGPTKAGEDSQLLVHWYRSEPTAAKLPAHREAWLWDLRPDRFELTGVVHFLVGDDAASSLELFVPEDLSLERIDATLLNAASSDADARERARLIDWSSAPPQNGRRRLRLVLESPVTGTVQVTLKLGRAGIAGTGNARTKTVDLTLPAPRGRLVTDGGHVAVRPSTLTVTRIRQGRLTKIDSTAFPEMYWRAVGRRDAQSLHSAYALPAGAADGATMSLTLQIPDVRPAVTQELNLDVYASQVDFAANVEARGDAQAFAFLEYSVPGSQGARIVEVRGPDVRHWSQTQGRVQIWFRSAVNRTRFVLEGHVDVSKSRRLVDVPRLRPLNVKALQTTINLRAQHNAAIYQPKIYSGRLIPGKPASDRTLSYQSDAFNYRAVFEIRAAALPKAVLLSSLRVHNRSVRLEHVAQLQARDGSELRRVELRLRNWIGPEPNLQTTTPGCEIHHQLAAENREHTWSVSFPPGHKSARVTLTASLLSDDDRRDFELPILELSPVIDSLHLIGIDRGRFQVAATKRVRRRATLNRAENEALQLLKIDGRDLDFFIPLKDDWDLRLALTPAPAPEDALRIVRCEQEVVSSVARRWLRRTVWWVHLREPMLLNIDLPSVDGRAANLEDLLIDGRSALDKVNQRRFPRFSLPSLHAGAHRICAYWRFAGDVEPGLQPQLVTPVLGGKKPSSVTWIVHVPPQHEIVSSSSAFQSGPRAAAVLELARATAQQQIAEMLTKLEASSATLRQSLEEAQQRFYEHARSADHWLGLAAAQNEPTNDVRRQLQTLEEKNQLLAKQAGFEPLRRRVEKQIDIGNLVAVDDADRLTLQGTPHYHVQPVSAAPPPLVLAPKLAARKRSVVMATVALLFGLMLIWILSRYRQVRTMGRIFWPEHLAVGGCLAALAYGLTLPILAVLALAVAGRTVLLVSMLFVSTVPSSASALSRPSQPVPVG